MGITWHANRTAFPSVGDAYYEVNLDCHMIYDGSNWVRLSSHEPAFRAESLIPSEENLQKHPSLKAAWEEYLVIKKLLGV